MNLLFVVLWVVEMTSSALVLVRVSAKYDNSLMTRLLRVCGGEDNFSLKLKDHFLKSFAGCSAYLVWVTISQLNLRATVKVRVSIWSNNAPITSILTSLLLCLSVFHVKAPHDCVQFRVKR